ncbi:MAG: alpha/beta fold hydrolase [Candidatus Methylomirabilaceae bacterium]
MPHVVVSGTRLAYHEWPGNGPTLLSVHGITANCHAWDFWAERLTPRFRLIALDLRGRGDSDKPPAYPVEVHRDPLCYARDLDALCSALGVETVHYLGHSLGAMIGVLFAATFPHRVRRLVLVDGGHELRPGVVSAIRPALDRLGMTFPSLEDYIERMRALPVFAGRWNDYLVRYFRYDVERLADGNVRSRISREVVEIDTETMLPLRLSSYYEKIAAPTLIVCAPGGLLTDSDPIMSGEEGTRLAAAIPNARLLTVGGANHYTILFDPDPEVLQGVKQFLSD